MFPEAQAPRPSASAARKGQSRLFMKTRPSRFRTPTGIPAAGVEDPVAPAGSAPAGNWPGAADRDGTVEIGDDLLLVPDVIPGGNDIDPVAEKLPGDIAVSARNRQPRFRRWPPPGRRYGRSTSLPSRAAQRQSPGPADHISNKQNFQTGPLSYEPAEWLRNGGDSPARLPACLARLNPDYLAYSMARVSRITLTLICPG